MSNLVMCPDCRETHVNVRCPKAPKLCVNGRTAHADGHHHYVSPPSEVICRECMDAISKKLRDLDRAAQERAEDYYETIILQRGASRAVDILADGCRKKDAAIATLAADLDRLRVVWRAVAECFGDLHLPQTVADAAIEAGLADEQRDDAGSVTVLTPDGERLARGGDRG